MTRALNAEAEVERLTAQLAEARGEVCALESTNGELVDDLEQMAREERAGDRA